MTVERCPIGCVPIVWNNVDLPDLGPVVPFAEILDTFARLGYEGTQFGRGFPEGADLARALGERDLRFSELYSALPSTANGLAADADEVARRDLARLVAAGGEVLCVAVHGSPERESWSGRVPEGAPRWPDRAFDALADLLEELAAEAPERVRVVFHPHTATWVEDPEEVEALASRLDGTRAGLCLDVGHYLVGGGDPVAAIRRYGSLVRHIHAKDVDGSVLERLRSAELDGFGAAVRERLFTELGNGELDVVGVVAALDDVGYDGWIMVEQDSTWLAPAEAAAIGGRVLRHAVRERTRVR